MTVKNARAEQAFLRARVKLLLTQFFWGQLASNLILVQRDDIPTACIDGRHLFYNPEWFLTHTEEEQRGIVAHEVSHCANGHIWRRHGREPRRWNIACDFVVNLELQEAKFKLPKCALIDPAYAGMSAEEVYDLLPEQPSGGGTGQPGGAMDGIMDPDSNSSLSPQQQQREWEIATLQAAEGASKMGAQAGNIPARLQRHIDEIKNPKVPWRDVLQRFITSISRNDYSWRRANRKFIPQGVYFPSMYSEEMGPLAVIVDTSGSISGPILAAFAAEIQSICDATRPEKITIVYADAGVNHVDEFQRGESIKIEPHGGGGTDFRPAVDLLSKDPPVAAIYLTDLEGPVGEEPAFPMLWCCTTTHTAPWGETVRLEL